MKYMIDKELRQCIKPPPNLSIQLTEQDKFYDNEVKMRYRMLLLASLMLAGTLAMTTVAGAVHRSSTVKGQEMTRSRISGTIESIQGERATVITEDGEQIGVALGPREYWGQRGGRLTGGSQVSMDVWGDPYGRTDWFFAGAIWGPGFHLELTNDYGVPYWVDDFERYDDWSPCYDQYTDWYGCGPGVYNYVLPPPPPVRYYQYYPRGCYPHHYRTYYRSYDYGRHDRYYDGGGRHDRGHHRGWEKGKRIHGRDRDDDDDRGDRRRDGRRIRGR